MCIKKIGQPLDEYECIQLLDKAAEYGIAVRRDEKNSDNLIVACKNPFTSGYMSVPITDCAIALAKDLEGQTHIREQLRSHGVELESFGELRQALACY